MSNLADALIRKVADDPGKMYEKAISESNRTGGNLDKYSPNVGTDAKPEYYAGPKGLKWEKPTTAEELNWANKRRTSELGSSYYPRNESAHTSKISPRYEYGRQNALSDTMVGMGAYADENMVPEKTKRKVVESVAGAGSRYGQYKGGLRRVTRGIIDNAIAAAKADNDKGTVKTLKDVLGTTQKTMEEATAPIIKKYDELRKTMSPSNALEQLPPAEAERIRQLIEGGWITADAGGPNPMLKTALLRKVAAMPEDLADYTAGVGAPPSLPRGLKLEDLRPGTYKGSGTFPVRNDWLGKLFHGKLSGGFEVGDQGSVRKLKGEARVAPTALGYGTAAAGGGALGGGIGAMVSDNRLVGGLTGGAIGAVAAPLALLLASKQGWLDSLTKEASLRKTAFPHGGRILQDALRGYATATAPKPSKQRFSWQDGQRVQNPLWNQKDTVPTSAGQDAGLKSGIYSPQQLQDALQGRTAPQPAPAPAPASPTRAELRNGVFNPSVLREALLRRQTR